MREILKKPIRWEDGFVIPPDEPGLGVELNEEVALAHPWTGNDLHLMPRSVAGRCRRIDVFPDHASPLTPRPKD